VPRNLDGRAFGWKSLPGAEGADQAERFPHKRPHRQTKCEAFSYVLLLFKKKSPKDIRRRSLRAGEAGKLRSNFIHVLFLFKKKYKLIYRLKNNKHTSFVSFSKEILLIYS
jgi:hypothetical protein